MLTDYLSPDRDFSTLSLIDLLSARDQFHWHLMNKPNVVGTAVGLYRIRKTDPWPDKIHDPVVYAKHRGARTLLNSEVRPYSWPAILVFVDEWIEENNNNAKQQPSDFIPPAVYMPDGDKVPICVIKADREDQQTSIEGNFNFPGNLIGGGFPILAEVQEQEYVASIGCILTDGHLAYALTNRHVTGACGEIIYSIADGNKTAVGRTSDKQLTRLRFEDTYPGWPGKNIYVHADVGLIEVDDRSRWTTQIYGIGPIGPMANLNTRSLSLRIIGCRVKAYGAASGLMQGEICALFYRYKAVGGSEYVSDFLIGPATGLSLGTHPGDSGTVWVMESQQGNAPPMPIAVQWGGQVFLDGGTARGSSYALATSLTTICEQLDVDLVRDWDVDQPDYWGAVGHYSIANKACGVLQNPNLKKLMNANLLGITFDIGEVNKKNMQGLSKRDFVPLADVPDMVWKVGKYKRGGQSSPEHPNHFADMDRVLKPPLQQGATLLDICKANPQNVNVAIWQQYYDAVQKQFPAEKESRGLLPFRVWQFYKGMVEFVKAGDVEKFVCAAGIVSHYVGDACQPLHISYLFNGDPDRMTSGMVRNPKTKTKEKTELPLGTGVHSAYEDDMVNNHVTQIVTGVQQRLTPNARLPLFSGGQQAAVAVVALMARTFAAIQPMEIINAFVANTGKSPKDRSEALWNSVDAKSASQKTIGERTMDVMADGCLALAQVWESAWKEGGGDQSIRRLVAIDDSTFEKIYQDPSFMPSHTLDTIGPLLTGSLPSVTKKKTAPRKPRKGAH